MRKLAPLLLLAACGGTSQLAAPDAPTNNVSILISDDNGPVSGAQVAFVNADGTVAADTKTGDDGKAEAEIKAGASVTANTASGLVTVLDVNPGDALSIVPHDVTAPATKGELDITLPAEAGATGYSFNTSCTPAISGASPTLKLEIPKANSCGGANTFLAIASDANGFLAYALDTKGAMAAGPYTMPSAWTKPDTFTLDVAGIDAKQHGKITASLGTNVGFMTDTVTVANTATTGSAAMRWVSDQSIYGGLVVTVDDAAGAHHQTLREPVASQATEQKVDLSNDLAVWVAGTKFDSGSRTATVALSDKSDGTGLVEVDLAYNKTTWSVFGAPAENQSSVALALPKLPSSFDQFAPASTDTITPSASLIFVDSEKYDTLHLLAPYAAWYYLLNPGSDELQTIKVSN